MLLEFSNPWLLFCIAFALMLLGTFLMGRQGRNFITMDPVKRRVSMLEIEFPTEACDTANVMKGLFRLPLKEKQAAIQSLKSQLITDILLFMPGAYGGIWIMCLRIAAKMSPLGHAFFTVLAWAQVLCFLLDIIENIYLWRRIKPDAKSMGVSGFRMWYAMEITKWGFSLLGTVCGFSALAYFWLSGAYTASTGLFVGIFFLMIVLFVMAGSRKAT